MFTYVEILALGKLSDVDKTVKVLKGLSNKVEEIQEIEVGVHDHPDERSAHIAWIARFASRDDYETFQRHPEVNKTRSFLERVDAVAVHVSYPRK